MSVSIAVSDHTKNSRAGCLGQRTRGSESFTGCAPLLVGMAMHRPFWCGHQVKYLGYPSSIYLMIGGALRNELSSGRVTFESRPS
jgi:hypothetical protein